MKYIKCNLLKAIIVLVGTSLYAQNDTGKNYSALKDSILKDIGIVNTSDPRNYVTIFIENSQDRKVWKQNSLIASSYTFKREIDANSIIYVHFDKQSLEKVKMDYNFSIGSRLNDRKIEVSPFSEVGEKQKIINDAKPIDEISNNIVVLKDFQDRVMRKINAYLILENDIRGNNANYSNSENIFNSNKYNLGYWLGQAKGISPIDTSDKTQNKLLELRNKIRDYSSLLYPYLKDEGNTLNMYVEQLSSTNDSDKFRMVIDSFITHLTSLSFFLKQDSTIAIRKKSLYMLKNDIENLINLYDYFGVSGNQTQKVFNSLTNYNKINRDRLLVALKSYNSLYEGIKVESPTITDSDLSKNSDLLTSNVSLIDEMLKSMKVEIPLDLNEKINDIIYRSFFYGTIDLKKSTALEGDQLYIYLILTDPQDPNMKPIELPVAVFEVTALGWKFFKVSDSFNLIHSNYNTDDSADSFVSSNYKPVPGVSLLTSFAGYEKSDFWNVLYPSIGINLSYLDFYSNKDVEIGVGLIAGLFNNKLFFNIGYNLQASKKKSLYWGIGFSFVNLLNTFVKPNNSVGIAN